MLSVRNCCCGFTACEERRSCSASHSREVLGVAGVDDCRCCGNLFVGQVGLVDDLLRATTVVSCTVDLTSLGYLAEGARSDAMSTNFSRWYMPDMG